VRGTVSIGVVFSNRGPLDLPALLVQADQTLYRAKERGRNRIEVVSPEQILADSTPVSLEGRRRNSAAA
jgi:hypothetical protein